MPPDPDPISLAAVITTNIARLAAERGLTVEQVTKRAGMRLGFLSPVDGSKLRVMGIAAVAEVLGVELGDILDDTANPARQVRPAECRRFAT